MVAVVARFYNDTPKQDVPFLIAGCLAAISLVILVVLFVHLDRKRREKQKLRVLSIIDAAYMDGLAFEKYVAELLKEQGYSNVVLTERYDFGVDIIAVKDGVRWGIQVKRYSSMVKVAAVRQVVTALRTYNCQRAMVVTNSVFSRPATVLARSNDCVLVDRDELAKWIIAFQRGK